MLVATLKQINIEIAKSGFPVELVRGRGYHYYTYDDGTVFETHSVYSPYLYMSPAKRWIREGIEFGEKMRTEHV